MLAWSYIRGLRQFAEAIRQHKMPYIMGNHEFVMPFANRSKHFDGAMAPVLARFVTTRFYPMWLH
jgi:hypothetical protein